MAAVVLVLSITTSITVLQYGMRAVDTARSMTLAGQIMQSEMEILRLQNWAQICALPGTEVVNTTTTISSGNATALDLKLNSIADGFTCTRTVADIAGRTGIKTITLTTTWKGLDGRDHSVSFSTRYAQYGINDYFYVSH